MTKKEKIPRIIHQIWFGTNPKPKKWIKTVEDFAKHHGYKYMFWDDARVEKEFGHEFKVNKDLQAVRESFSHEPSGVADLYRYLILLKYGGIYIDADVVVLRAKRLDDFLTRLECDLFFAWEEGGDDPDRRAYHPTTSGMNRMLANSVIGATPNHKFFKDCFQEIYANFREGKGADKKYWAWIRTGPALVTEVWNKRGAEYPLLQAFPMRFFFPGHWCKNSKDPEQHVHDFRAGKMPPETMMFQYGYSTNKFHKVFEELEKNAKKNARGHHGHGHSHSHHGGGKTHKRQRARNRTRRRA